MINKEKADETNSAPLPKEPGYVDVAFLDMQCHVMIKDRDTGDILVNKRG